MGKTNVILTANLTLIFIFSIAAFGSSADAQPIIQDPNLKAELVVEGLSSPTSMAFIQNNSILVLEKNTGEVTAYLKWGITGRASVKIRR